MTFLTRCIAVISGFALIVTMLIVTPIDTAFACSYTEGWPYEAQTNLQNAEQAFVGTVKGVQKEDGMMLIVTPHSPANQRRR